MRGCLQVSGVVVAIAFIITTITAVFLTSLVRVVTDRDAVKLILEDVDQLIVEATPALVSRALQEAARQRGLPPLNVDEAVLQRAVDELLPPEWVAAQTETAVDAVYDALEQGDAATADIELDMGPLLERMRGAPGERLVGVIVESVPSCPEGTLPQNMGSNILIPSCIPPELPREQVVQQVHGQFVQAVEQNPQVIAGASRIRIPLFGEEVAGLSPQLLQAREQLERLQRTFNLARRWSWLLWLLPLGCLFLLTLLVVRSLRDWGLWWGWSLLFAAILTFVLTFVLPALAIAFLRLNPLPPQPDALIPATLLARRLLEAVTGVWLRGVYIQAAIMLALGALLVFVGFLAGTGRRPQQEYYTYR